jgi:hypothetical protein
LEERRACTHHVSPEKEKMKNRMRSKKFEGENLSMHVPASELARLRSSARRICLSVLELEYTKEIFERGNLTITCDSAEEPARKP